MPCGPGSGVWAHLDLLGVATLADREAGDEVHRHVARPPGSSPMATGVLHPGSAVTWPPSSAPSTGPPRDPRP